MAVPASYPKQRVGRVTPPCETVLCTQRVFVVSSNPCRAEGHRAFRGVKTKHWKMRAAGSGLVFLSPEDVVTDALSVG